MVETAASIATIRSAPFDENTYIAHLAGRNDCLVIDPGTEPDKILTFLAQNGLSPAVLLITHGHADHIAGNAALKEHFPECPIVIGHGDAAFLTDPQLNLSGPYGMPFVSPPADQLVQEGQVIDFAGFSLDVLEIPGHSPGHVVYVWKAVPPVRVFGGDVLFQGSIGRHDFPGGSLEKLTTGIKQKLFALPDDTVVYPGHGAPTRIGYEKTYNPFVGERRSKGVWQG